MNCDMTETEEKFAKLIWAHEPIGSGELVLLCRRELDWKKSTTYTVLKKLCDKGIFQNEDAIVSSRISEEGYAACRSQRFIEDTFGGSLPRFLTAFIGGRKLSKRQAEELKKLIEEHEEKQS